MWNLYFSGRNWPHSWIRWRRFGYSTSNLVKLNFHMCIFTNDRPSLSDPPSPMLSPSWPEFRQNLPIKSTFFLNIGSKCIHLFWGPPKGIYLRETMYSEFWHNEPPTGGCQSSSLPTPTKSIADTLWLATSYMEAGTKTLNRIGMKFCSAADVPDLSPMQILVTIGSGINFAFSYWCRCRP